MSVTIAVELAARSEELRALVDALTRPTKRALDDGPPAEVMPVLSAVVDARTARTEPRVKAAAPKHLRVVVRLTAVEVLQHVDRTVGGPRTTSRLERVRAWSERVIAMGSLEAVEDACEAANYWAVAADNMLAPSRVLPIRGATCPACGFRDVLGSDDAGDEAREPALAADLRSGVVSCAVDGCGASWAWDQLEHLAAQLDRQTATEVLAVE
ncbi:hypothetical protein ACFPK1_18900 [Actinomycetospora rhizophila]|uniref:DUF7340 domain-containing protein n=1 Tax=Actinomycetospora rhizophila TaxID=1416876 RepID=A0ABV9ZID6_9PSEU